MRHYFLYIFLLFTWQLKAQTDVKIFKAGVIGSLNSAQIDGDGYAGFDKVGWSIGGFVNRNIKEKLSYQFEINYITKGSFDRPDFNAGKFFSKKITLHYIEVPLLLKLQVKKIGLELGPTFATLVKYNETNTSGNLTSLQPFNKFELGYVLGADIKLSKRLNAIWRFQSSITPISDKMQFQRNFMGLHGGSYNLLLSLGLRYNFIKSS